MKIAVVVPRSIHGEQGGAENLYEGLTTALQKAGHDATQIDIPVDESSFEGILESYCRCFYLDLDEYDLVISTKAPTYMVRHTNHISYLLHPIRVFYDMFETELDPTNAEKQKQQKLIHAFDTYGLDPVRIRKHCVIGETVARRMRDTDPFWQKIDFDVIYPAPLITRFAEPKKGEFIFLPGRLHRWKRVDLVICAMQYLNNNCPLLLAGTGEDAEHLKTMVHELGLDEKVHFLGKVSYEELRELYARSIVIPFVPINEDFGYVTIEAFKTKKPVITCVDSGEPAEIVQDGESGFIVPPDPKLIAARIDYLIEHPDVGVKMGEAGYQAVQDITWDACIQRLLSDENSNEAFVVEGQANSSLHDRKNMDARRAPVHATPQNDRDGDRSHSRLQILVTDNQILDPPIGGGRVRIYQLYKHFNPGLFDITYLGTFDWLGPEERRQKLADHFTEVLVPMTVPHISMDKIISSLSGGKTTLDVTVPLLMHYTPKYQRILSDLIQDAAVVIVAHPWVYPYVKKEINKLKNKPLLIYDSQNVEYNIKKDILNSSLVGKYLVHGVKKIEGELVTDSDMIFVCSSDDADEMASLYTVNPEKISVIPNGASIEEPAVLMPEEKQSVRDRFGFDNKPIAVFLASGGYAPNDEAALYICTTLARELPMISFALMGSVCNAISENTLSTLAPNVTLLGIVSDQEKKAILSVSDIALNPVMQGSGTNIKNFDYLSAGLPVVTTPVGARGIDFIDSVNGIIADIENFPAAIHTLIENTALLKKISYNARILAEQYDWRTIAAAAGERIIQFYEENA